ncbi:MAG TPA: hypothetical protein VIG61_04930 [Fusobacterium sp.]|uniref:hypothetical protein n=1 Tax=Fusobacterium sp. TaxID=68766 RepID=UPI002F400C5A
MRKRIGKGRQRMKQKPTYPRVYLKKELLLFEKNDIDFFLYSRYNVSVMKNKNLKKKEGRRVKCLL